MNCPKSFIRFNHNISFFCKDESNLSPDNMIATGVQFVDSHSIDVSVTALLSMRQMEEKIVSSIFLMGFFIALEVEMFRLFCSFGRKL